MHRHANHAKHDWRDPLCEDVPWCHYVSSAKAAPLQHTSSSVVPDPASSGLRSATSAGSQGATTAIAELLQKQIDAVQHHGLHKITAGMPQVVISELMKVTAELQLKVATSSASWNS